MTHLEAMSVCLILTNADGGCFHCASALFDEFVRRFPKHEADALYVWRHSEFAEYSDDWRGEK